MLARENAQPLCCPRLANRCGLCGPTANEPQTRSWSRPAFSQTERRAMRSRQGQHRAVCLMVRGMRACDGRMARASEPVRSRPKSSPRRVPAHVHHAGRHKVRAASARSEGGLLDQHTGQPASPRPGNWGGLHNGDHAPSSTSAKRSYRVGLVTAPAQGSPASDHLWQDPERQCARHCAFRPPDAAATWVGDHNHEHSLV